MTSLLRAGRDDDAEQLIALIAACWGLYPGVRMDVDGEMPELHALATYYARAGGMLWVAEAAGSVVGMAATRPLGADDPASWELCRVYVHPSQHGGGLGHALVGEAETFAMGAGATRMVLWSDTRFDRAHRFYEKRSYVRDGPIRVLHDISNSLEFGYAKPVDGIALLDAAAAASAERRLADVLSACVAGGASLGFLPPLLPPVARAFWKRVTSGIAAGTHALLCGWSQGVLRGAVVLDLDLPPNQAHRVALRMLLVHPEARRRGLGRALLQRAEQEAVQRQRFLLTLETRAGDAADHMLRKDGWQELGRIPGYTRRADGSQATAAFFWKMLAAPG